MKTRSIPAPRRPRPPVQGFALVVALCLMVLLMVLAGGMLSMSAISLRTSAREASLEQARRNARFALQLAIGELQTLAGPDRRVTAPSSIGDHRLRQLTGVWEGWKWKGDGATPDWSKEKKQRFKGWLISSPEPTAVRSPDFADQAAAGERIRLVSASGEDEAVEAPLVQLASTSERAQEGYAWAVFDESQKTPVSLPAASGDASFAHQYDRMGAAARPGFAAVTAHDWKTLAKPETEGRKLLTTGQLTLAGVERKESSFHDLTTGSLGLLTNVADGGFSGDLSRLFDTAQLPADYASRFLYSDADAPLVAPPTRFTGGNPLPSPDPAWSLLHSHYRSYARILENGRPMIDASVTSVTARPPAGTTGAQALRHKAFTEQQLAPAIAKAQFVFSVAFGYNQDTLDQMYSDGSARKTPLDQRDNYITWIVIDPVITLWNPYNVPMRFSGARIDLYRIPLAFRLYKNGQLVNAAYTKLTNAHTREDFKTRENRYYRLNILPETGEKERILQPGEHVVFTAHNHKVHGDHAYNLVGVTLRPGFNPPAGAASSAEIGGVTTQNIFVDDQGNSSGKDYGKVVRTVAVKAGDRIQVEVDAERAGIDDFKETGGREVTGFLKYYLGGANVSRLLGGIELNYGDREKELLPHFPPEDLPTIVVSRDIPVGQTAGLNPATHALRWKEPFLLATFQQKTERDSRFPSRSWVDNGPGNLYASAGLDQTEDFAHHQYEFKWEAMTDWPPNSPTIEISNTANRGYGGPGIYAQSGSEFATFASLPLAPAHSLAQLRHAPINAGGQLPLTRQVVGNSFAPPLLGDRGVRADAGNRTYLDHSYLANSALFDSWFLSSAADHPALDGAPAREAKDLLDDFFNADQPLPNPRFVPYPGTEKAEELAKSLATDADAYRRLGAHLLIDGPFNVNSTRVAAWQALLASNFGGAAPVIEKGQLGLSEGGDLPVLRNLPAVAEDYESSGHDPASSDEAKWNGYRRLNSTEIARLAEEMVREVKQRGPFQSLAEFVNRRPGDGDFGKQGALEAAIERAGLNAAVLDSLHGVGDGGNTADGAPGVINQADLLTPLAPQLTARGDTFRIRTYGEATGPDGAKVRAWAEATVQRLPGYVDARESAADLPASEVNRTFGRRFEITSFRWLGPREI